MPQPPPPPPRWPRLPALPLLCGSVHASQRDELPRGRTLTKSLWAAACLPFAGREPGCRTSSRLERWGGCDSGDNRCLLKPQGTSLIASSPSFCLATGGVQIHPQSYISALSVMWPFGLRGVKGGGGPGWHSLSPLTLCRLSLGCVWSRFCVSD